MMKMSLLIMNFFFIFGNSFAATRCEIGQLTSVTLGGQYFCPDDSSKCPPMPVGTQVRIVGINFWGSNQISSVKIMVSGKPVAKEVRNEAGQLVACQLDKNGWQSGSLYQAGTLPGLPFDCD